MNLRNLFLTIVVAIVIAGCCTVDPIPPKPVEQPPKVITKTEYIYRADLAEVLNLSDLQRKEFALLSEQLSGLKDKDPLQRSTARKILEKAITAAEKVEHEAIAEGLKLLLVDAVDNSGGFSDQMHMIRQLAEILGVPKETTE